MLVRIAGQSLLSRKETIALTVFSIALSAAILIVVEHFRAEAKNSFSKTVSGIDLIVGARTGQLNLLLYSVFRIGNATNNIGYKSYEEISNSPQVAWTIPISLGDSHRGYRVMGTTENYFQYFKYGQQQPLQFLDGLPFDSIFGTVLGYEVAERLHYKIGEKITLAHGVGSISFTNHDDNPFRVVGILKPTGTPADKTVHVSLAGLEAIHLGWTNGVKLQNTLSLADLRLSDDLPTELQPKSITAFMVGLNSKIATFSLQRQINDYKSEPLTAILPGVALAELWQMLATFERMLQLISALVLVAALFGMAAVLLTALRERHKELLVLRTLGASPRFIVLFVECEAFFVTASGLILGVTTAWFGILIGQSYLASHYGLFINVNIFQLSTLWVLIAVLIGGLVIGLFPAAMAYRSSLEASRL